MFLSKLTHTVARSAELLVCRWPLTVDDVDYCCYVTSCMLRTVTKDVSA